MTSLAALDPNFAVSVPGSDLLWYDALALTTLGQGWARSELAAPWDRLPARAQGVVRPEVWGLSHCSAGIEVRFATDACEVSARWTVTNASLAMDHMPATGVSGLDLYVLRDDGWRWTGIGRPTQSPTNQVRLAGDLPTAGMRSMRLYLPLYNGIASLAIGVPAGARLQPLPAPAALPLVVYGTSIVQGGCASRPGMVYSSILGRRLDLPVINLGFSGNGRAEPEVARLVAEIPATAFVVDAVPNLSAELVTERLGGFVDTLRTAHPRTPIVVVENITYQHHDTMRPGRSDDVRKNQALRAVIGPRMATDPLLHIVPGALLLGDDGEGTVDGVHATDVGFSRLAAVIAPVLRSLLPREIIWR